MITPFKADLHLHSALSPCADKEMTPAKIIHGARAKGLNIIALTDHNTCLNVPALIDAARGSGITVIPAMEVQTREEVHMACYFPGLEESSKWQEKVYRHLPELKNKPQVFGEQLIMDARGKIIGEEERLLLTSTSFSVEEVVTETAALGGFCLPAHIDRPSYSLLSALGFIPPGLKVPALEISRLNYAEEMLLQQPELGHYTLVTSSDAHGLTDLGARMTTFWLEGPSFDEIALALPKTSGRKAVPQVKELSMHILDIVQNSAAAGATEVAVAISEDLSGDLLSMEITDNGRGMAPEMLAKVTDPFFTTRTTRKVGLGVPLLKAAAERCDGNFEINSSGAGTKVMATFRHSHIDRAPLGNMTETIVAIIMGHPELDLVYTHQVDGQAFRFEAAELRRELEDVPLNNPAVINWIRGYLAEGYEKLYNKNSFQDK